MGLPRVTCASVALAALLCATLAGAALAAAKEGSIFIHNGGSVSVRQLKNGRFAITLSAVAPQSTYLTLGSDASSISSGLAETSGAVGLAAASDLSPKRGVLLFQTQSGTRASLIYITSASYNIRTRALTLVARQLDGSKAGRMGRFVDAPMLPLGPLATNYGGSTGGRQLLRFVPGDGSVYVDTTPPDCSGYSYTVSCKYPDSTGPVVGTFQEASCPTKGSCNTCNDAKSLAQTCSDKFSKSCPVVNSIPQCVVGVTLN